LADHKDGDTSFYHIPFTITDSFHDMPYRPLGSSGLRVPNVGLGTWKVGYPETGDGSRVGEELAFKLFERAIELGVTFWDTANRYNAASGNSERVIGNWFINNPHQRRNVILATKVFGAMDGITPNHCGLSRGNILESVYASLDRLQTDYIDLLYFHAFDSSAPIEESLAAIEDLVRQDLVHYFGVSNFTVQNLKDYLAVQSKMTVRSKMIAVQNQFDVLHYESEKYSGVLNYAQESGISFVAWSPLAGGLLSEKYLNPENIGKGDRLFDEGVFQDKVDQVTGKKLEKLTVLAHQWDLKLSQLALAYILSIPGMGPVIPTSSTISQLESNAMIGKIKLSDEQKDQIQLALK
jgi:aryl-alcohol dehydrogenase-like predicted oxidoreductase